MWDTIRWQILNANEIEVSPDHRSLAWRELILNVANNTPLDHTFRTMLKRVDLENFDYNTPIVYNLKDKTLKVYNERLRVALNRPVSFNNQTINVKIAHILLVFICVVLLCALAVFRGANKPIGAIKNDFSTKNK